MSWVAALVRDLRVWTSSQLKLSLDKWFGLSDWLFGFLPHMPFNPPLSSAPGSFGFAKFWKFAFRKVGT